MSVLDLVNGLIGRHPHIQQPLAPQVPAHPLMVQLPRNNQPLESSPETPNIQGGPTSVLGKVTPGRAAQGSFGANIQQGQYFNQQMPQPGVHSYNLDQLSGVEPPDTSPLSWWEKMMLSRSPEEVRHELGLDQPVAPLGPLGAITPKRPGLPAFQPHANGSTVVMNMR